MPFASLLTTLGFLGTLANLVSGVLLTRDVAADSSLHASLGFATLGLLTLGHVMALKISSGLLRRQMEANVLNKGISQNEPLQSLIALKQKASVWALTTIVSAVISILTGTISQTGHFPLIHGLFGIWLIISSFIASLSWFKMAKGIK